MASIIQVGSSWRASVRLSGHPPQHKTFPLKRDAVAWATDLEAKLRRQEPTTGDNITVSKLIEGYKTLRAAGGREVDTKSNTHFMLKHLEEAFGSQKAALITAQDYVNWVKEGLENKRGKVALAMELRTLQTIYKRGEALNNIKLPDQLNNAVILLTQMGMIEPQAKYRERVPKGDELQRVIQQLPTDELKHITILASRLGFRRGEILSLRWSDFNPETRMILVRNRKHPRQKVGNDSLVPLVMGTFELLNELVERKGEFIFPSYSKENISDWFLKACRACTPKVENLHFHDLRHMAITGLFEAGLQIQQVALISGHKSWHHLKRYTNLNPEDLHDEFDGNLITA